MFTGLITAVGYIETVTPLEGNAADGLSGCRLMIDAGAKFNQTACGDSIAVQGACLTVTAANGPRLAVEVSRASLDCTIGLNAPGAVNLEKALRAGDQLGGHFVTGHVDGIGMVTYFAPVGESRELRILSSRSIGRYLAYKGSIAVNGVSLTVNSVEDREQGCEFSINLIPYTLKTTTLQHLKMGARVNLEVDLVARYTERMIRAFSI